MNTAENFIQTVQRRLQREYPDISVDFSLPPNTATFVGAVSIEQLWSEENRQQGRAGAALTMICAQADIGKITLRLTPRPLLYDIDFGGYAEHEEARLEALNDKAMTTAQLVDWYRRHGFHNTTEVDGDSFIMERAPIKIGN